MQLAAVLVSQLGARILGGGDFLVDPLVLVRRFCPCAERCGPVCHRSSHRYSRTRLCFTRISFALASRFHKWLQSCIQTAARLPPRGSDAPLQTSTPGPAQGAAAAPFSCRPLLSNSCLCRSAQVGPNPAMLPAGDTSTDSGGAPPAPNLSPGLCRVYNVGARS